jgi:hypothetical protein
LSLRLDRDLARLGGTALIPVLLLALACAGPIGGVALARISMASAYGKAHGQTTGGLAGLVPELRPELRVGLKLWSPLGIQRTCTCGERS